MEKKKELYSLKEVAEILNVSYMTVYRYLSRLNIKAIRIGGRWKISSSQLEKIIGKENVKEILNYNEKTKNMENFVKNDHDWLDKKLSKLLASEDVKRVISFIFYEKGFSGDDKKNWYLAESFLNSKGVFEILKDFFETIITKPSLANNQIFDEFASIKVAYEIFRIAKEKGFAQDSFRDFVTAKQIITFLKGSFQSSPNF